MKGCIRSRSAALHMRLLALLKGGGAHRRRRCSHEAAEQDERQPLRSPLHHHGSAAAGTGEGAAMAVGAGGAECRERAGRRGCVQLFLEDMWSITGPTCLDSRCGRMRRLQPGAHGCGLPTIPGACGAAATTHAPCTTCAIACVGRPCQQQGIRVGPPTQPPPTGCPTACHRPGSAQAHAPWP